MTDTPVEYNASLGRRARTGSWQEQKISTYAKIREALTEARFDDAARLASYFVDEAQVCFLIYRQWIPDLRAFLLEQGVSKEEVAAADAAVHAKLALPDGTPFDAYRQWDRFRNEIDELVGLIHRERVDAALAKLDEAKETWRRCHDRDVDHTYGLMDAIHTRFGDAAIGPMWDRVLWPLFAWRYDKFDIDKNAWDVALDALMTVACEAMRGHLVGPERTGDFELEELEDRYVLRFDPCASGGRTLRGDDVEGTPPRMEPPYDWSVSTEPYSWNHFTKGICHYCTHCIRLMEEWPMDRFGYPVRTVTPPVYRGTDEAGRPQKCTWEMFKDPTQVPESYYERVGRTKPTAFGGKAHGAEELPPVPGMPGAG